MQVFLSFCVCAHAKRGSWSQAFLVKAMETGDKNRSVMKPMYRIESCERCWAFLEWVGPRVLSLESIDYFGTSDYFSGRKEKITLMRKSSMFRSSVVNCRCMQMSLVMSVRFIFGNDWNDAPCSSHFLDFCVFTHAFWSIQKQIVEYNIKSKYSEEYPTVDKVGSGKLLARKSCLMLNISPLILRAVSYFFLSHSRSTALLYFFARCAWLCGTKDNRSQSNRLLISYLIFKQARLNAVNPLSSNIHIPILHTDLHTFLSWMSWENLIKDQGIFPKVIILLILIT